MQVSTLQVETQDINQMRRPEGILNMLLEVIRNKFVIEFHNADDHSVCSYVVLMPSTTVSVAPIMNWPSAGTVCVSCSRAPKKTRVGPCLSVCEVVLAQLFPQQTVLSEKPQLRTHLAQAHQVPAVRQALHDVELQAGRQVGQHHASR